MVKGWDRVIEGSRFESQCDKKKYKKIHLHIQKKKKKIEAIDLTVFMKNLSTSKFNLHHLYNFMDLLIQ